VAAALILAGAPRMLDATRLHLQEGPIDLIVEAFGRDQATALHAAAARFDGLLAGLVAELPLLRAPLGRERPKGPVAARMAGAVAPFQDVFVTPMAAVAGAVADEVCAAMVRGLSLERAYVNNGGDIAVWLAPGQSLTAAIHDGADAGRVEMSCDSGLRGLATSGWRGRSYSLGIADAVTVLARSAAEADVAATLIANAVDLPGSAKIKRTPAVDMSPDSDLGARPVTVDVAPLSPHEVARALEAGLAVAEKLRARDLIGAAALFLAGETRLSGGFPARTALERTPDHVRFSPAQNATVS
jgi:ApbE superfamily uncharacterized protein (UPF0280 family)